VALARVAVVLVRVDVDRAEPADLGAQAVDLLLQLGRLDGGRARQRRDLRRPVAHLAVVRQAEPFGLDLAPQGVEGLFAPFDL
jgi:hypothetical protein